MTDYQGGGSFLCERGRRSIVRLVSGLSLLNEVIGVVFKDMVLDFELHSSMLNRTHLLKANLQKVKPIPQSVTYNVDF